jgi:hypothetical protein
MKPAFALVKRVVRGTVELPTFRFSAGFSLAETISQTPHESPAHPRNRWSVD